MNSEWNIASETVGTVCDSDHMHHFFLKYRTKTLELEYEDFSEISLSERRAFKNQFLSEYLVALLKTLLTPKKFEIIAALYEAGLYSFGELVAIINRNTKDVERKALFEKLIDFELTIEGMIRNKHDGFDYVSNNEIEGYYHDGDTLYFNKDVASLESYLWFHDLLHESKEFPVKEFSRIKK